MKLLRPHFYIRRSKKVVRDVRHRLLGLPWLAVESRDRFVFSWPRSGNTWLRHMLFFYMTGAQEIDMDRLNAFCPTVDNLDFKQRLDDLGDAPYRFIKSHEPASDIFLKGKIAYIVRDGRDATLSYHDYRKKIHGQKEDFDTFLRQCVNNRIRYGSWARNVGSWLAFDANPAMLILKYEDILDDPHGSFVRILQHFEIEIDADRVEAAIRSSSIDRVNKTFGTLTAAAKGPGFSGGLGGGSGKWRSTYTEEQLDIFMKASADVMSKLGYA